MDDGSVLIHITREILQRKSIIFSSNQRILESGRAGAVSTGTNMQPIAMYRDLDLLSQQITEAMFLILNDPYYYCNTIFKFFNSH